MAISAVITADIVNSTSLTKEAHKKLIATLESLLDDYKFEFYRGDSFQVYLREKEKVLELIFKIRTAAKKIITSSKPLIDVRTGVGIGHVKSAIRDLKASTEEPFVLSGRSLDELSSSDDRLRIQSFDDNANCVFRLISRFTDYIFKQLTSKQAAVIFELLLGHTQTDAAKRLKKSQVTVNKQSHAAGWIEIERLLSEYEFAITQFNLK